MKWKALIFVLLSGISAGCSKNPVDIPTIGSMDSTMGSVPVPFDYDGLMGTKASYLYPACISPVTGVLITDRERRILRDSMQVIVIDNKVWNTATFLSSNGHIGAYGGDVRLNNIALTYDPPHAFYMNSDPALWIATGTNTWSATGNAHVPAISQVPDTTFPQFTGSLPDTITISGNFTFTFDNSNLHHANAAYLIVYDSNMRLTHTNLAGPSGGTVSYDFGNRPPINSWLWIGNQRYYGVWMEVVCYNYEIHTFSGKSFAFVRQSRLLKNVVVR